MKTNAELAAMIRAGYAGIVKQGKRAANGNGCKYRTNNGLKCFVGHLIPDSNYDPAMENGGIRVRPNVQQVLGVQGDANAIDTLSVCQTAHDMSMWIFDGDEARWLRNLKRECNRQLQKLGEAQIP